MNSQRPNISVSRQTYPPLLTPNPLSPGPSNLATTVASLRLHAAYIRDILPPLLLQDTPHLPPQELYMLTTILARIATLHPITIDMLRQSRVQKALYFITATPKNEAEESRRGRWPPDSVFQAKKILNRWRKELGRIDNLHVNLFAPEEKLHGLSPVKAYKITHRSVVIRDEVSDTVWTLDRQPNIALACKQGHGHLSVGDWWINLASLFRDNGITHPGRGIITWDDNRAYAVVLACPKNLPGDANILDFARKMHESAWDEGTELKFKVSNRDKGVFKLMRTMGTNEEACNNVRVFRHTNWGGKYAPRGGVRYDGLYRLISYSVHLSPPNSWTYTFTLHRENDQTSLASILHIPNSEQYDDWETFTSLRSTDLENDAKDIEESVPNSMERLERFVRTKTIMSGIMEEIEEERGRTPLRTPAIKRGDAESGYFSLPRTVSGRMTEDERKHSPLKTPATKRGDVDSGYFSLPRTVSGRGNGI